MPVLLFAAILACGIVVSFRAPDPYGRLLAFGFTFMITLQAAINVGVVTGCLPTKGLPLPFISYGGSSMLMSVAGVAVIGVQQMNGADSGPAVQPLAQQQEYIRMAPPATLVAEGKEESAVRSEVLDRYLVNHNEYSANSGIQGVLPYVRIVGHKVNQ